MEPKRFLECGKIVSTHGIRGEVRVQPWCDGADFLCGFDTLYLKKGQVPLRVRQARVSKNMALLKLEGVDSVDDAVTLRGKILYIDREAAPDLAEGSFYIQDLIGLTVKDADTGRVWGALRDVLATGANDVYELEDEDGTKRLLPAIRDVVLETDLEAGVMTVRPLKGLFDDAD